jgi:cation:H+ antiporter
MLLSIILLVVGLGLLIGGADGLVRGAASLAAKLRVSPLIIGLTVVSFGTSAPELTVNMVAALNGSADLAIGNVVGSNIANILLVLGVCAVITPLTVKSSTVWKEIPLALLGAVLLFVMGNDQLLDRVPFNAITRTDGIVLMSLLAIFMYYIFGLAKTDRPEDMESDKITQYSYPRSTVLVLAGLAGLVIGGRLMVNSAVSIAQAAGLSQSLIGLTVVAIGTSLPELATSVVAALKKQADIAIGNVVGSNIFNVFWIIGLTSTLLQLPFNAAINVDVLVGVGATMLLFAFMFTSGKHRLVRWEGALFLGLYSSYIIYLIQRG